MSKKCCKRDSYGMDGCEWIILLLIICCFCSSGAGYGYNDCYGGGYGCDDSFIFIIVLFFLGCCR